MDLFGMYGAKQDDPEPSLFCPVPGPAPNPPAPGPPETPAEVTAPHGIGAVDRELAQYVAEIGVVVGDGRHLMRPYARTGGRTRPSLRLNLETLVTTRSPHHPPADATHRFVCELCRESRSVAEVSAYSNLPLGVAKVLVADLAKSGFVLIHHDLATVDGPSLQLMERVLVGLRRL